MPVENPYERLQRAANREEMETEMIAFVSLQSVQYATLQSIASEYDIYPEEPPTQERLRRVLSEAGFFYGDVGDDTLYRHHEGETAVVRDDT